MNDENFLDHRVPRWTVMGRVDDGPSLFRPSAEVYHSGALPQPGSRVKQFLQFELSFGSQEPFFKGHFPGRPVVPAALLVSAVAARLEQGAGLRIAAASKLRFTAPALPDQPLSVTCEARPAGGWRVRVRQGEGEVMRGILEGAQ